MESSIGASKPRPVPPTTAKPTALAEGNFQLFHGDALSVVRGLTSASVDAVITDPPYSSGGTFSAERVARSTRQKYVSSNAKHTVPDFPGDNRDQRSYGYWCTLWLAECLRVSKPGGVCLLFTDWRQLPTVTDALQAGGWIWRGVVPWAKPGARPAVGRFRSQCEYVVWGSAGAMNPAVNPVNLPGFYQVSAPRKRQHITQKPLQLMQALVQIVPPGGTVLDPFAGSGTTGVASLTEGRHFVGVELSEHFYAVAMALLSRAADGAPSGAGSA